MQHIPHLKSKIYKNGAVTSWEYETQSKDMNLALIQIDGRYPEEGYTSNLEVDSLVQITKGSGTLGTDDGSIYEIEKGDQIHFAVNDAYFFEGSLELIYAATPKWTPRQATHIH